MRNTKRSIISNSATVPASEDLHGHSDTTERTKRQSNMELCPQLRRLCMSNFARAFSRMLEEELVQKSEEVTTEELYKLVTDSRELSLKIGVSNLAKLILGLVRKG